MKTNFNDRHPELRPGEKWVGNMRDIHFEESEFKTKRLGETSFALNGQPLNDELFAPMFVNAKEVANFTDIPQNFKEGDSVIFYNSEVLLRGTIKEEQKLLWIIEDFDGCKYILEKETVINNCLVPNNLKPYDEETYNLMKFEMEESQNLILFMQQLVENTEVIKMTLKNLKEKYVEDVCSQCERTRTCNKKHFMIVKCSSLSAWNNSRKANEKLNKIMKHFGIE